MPVIANGQEIPAVVQVKQGKLDVLVAIPDGFDLADRDNQELVLHRAHQGLQTLSPEATRPTWDDAVVRTEGVICDGEGVIQHGATA